MTFTLSPVNNRTVFKQFVIIRVKGLNMLKYAIELIRLKSDREGVTALEYGLIAGLIVATIAIGFGILGSQLSNEFSGIGDSL